MFKSARKHKKFQTSATIGIAVALSFGAAGCAPSSAPAETPGADSGLGISDEDYSLEALIAAAKKEDAINVYDSTGKIVEIAENFTEEYGVEALGVKVSADTQVDMIIREAQSKNVQGDVLLVSDPAIVSGQLIPQGYVASWMPPDMTDVIPEELRDPLVINFSSSVWAYNTELNESCPISNIWALTDAEWKNKVYLQDPLLKPLDTDFFNQLETHEDDAVAAAYEEYFGEPLKTDEASATAEWVKRLAANGPMLTKSSDPIAEAIGAPGQTTEFFGDVATSKFRENEDSGFKLGLCDTMKPWVGRIYPKVGVIATSTKSPNASKLFIRYLLTEEGIQPQLDDGKPSSNSTLSLPDDEASGLSAFLDQVYTTNLSTLSDDVDRRQDWQDLWQTSYAG